MQGSTRLRGQQRPVPPRRDNATTFDMPVRGLQQQGGEPRQEGQQVQGEGGKGTQRVPPQHKGKPKDEWIMNTLPSVLHIPVGCGNLFIYCTLLFLLSCCIRMQCKDSTSRGRK